MLVLYLLSIHLRHNIKPSLFSQLPAKTDGQILYYVSKELRDDYDVVLETVKNKGLIVKYASKRLRSDKTIAIEAIKNDKRAYDFIVPELRQDEEIQAVINPPA